MQEWNPWLLALERAVCARLPNHVKHILTYFCYDNKASFTKLTDDKLSTIQEEVKDLVKDGVLPKSALFLDRHLNNVDSFRFLSGVRDTIEGMVEYAKSNEIKVESTPSLQPPSNNHHPRSQLKSKPSFAPTEDFTAVRRHVASISLKWFKEKGYLDSTSTTADVEVKVQPCGVTSYISFVFIYFNSGER